MQWSTRVAGVVRLACGARAVTLRDGSHLQPLDRLLLSPARHIDEVEEIASKRGGEPPSPTQGVTNELLKQVGQFRDREGRLLICATNFVRALDAAFLRHGRFDYVIPIGLPDATAREAIWSRYIPEHTIAGVDLDVLVNASDGLTPADIEYAARRASQEALAS